MSPLKMAKSWAREGKCHHRNSLKIVAKTLSKTNQKIFILKGYNRGEKKGG